MDDQESEEILRIFSEFTAKWRHLDPECTGQLSPEAFISLIQEVSLPLGTGGLLSYIRLMTRLSSWGVPVWTMDRRDMNPSDQGGPVSRRRSLTARFKQGAASRGKVAPQGMPQRLMSRRRMSTRHVGGMLAWKDLNNTSQSSFYVKFEDVVRCAARVVRAFCL